MCAPRLQCFCVVHRSSPEDWRSSLLPTNTDFCSRCLFLLIPCENKQDSLPHFDKWFHSQRRLLEPTCVPPQGAEGAADLEVIKGLVEDTLFSTQPAMVLSLRPSACSPAVRNLLLRPISIFSRQTGFTLTLRPKA